MLATGWGDKPGVRILFGRWQDVLDQLQPGRRQPRAAAGTAKGPAPMPAMKKGGMVKGKKK